MQWKLFFVVLFVTVNISSQDVLSDLINFLVQILLGGLNLLLGDIDFSIYSNIGIDFGIGEKEFDYIVVGSGSAGAALTSKLVKNGKKVLLLETGGPPWVTAAIPFLASVQQFTPQNWNYLMEKQDNLGMGLDNNLMAWPRGRVLGGTSEINMMIHIRGNKWDYDRWEAAGNPGWSYANVLPIFKEIEKARIAVSDPDYHGYSGPLDATDIPYRTISSNAFVESAQQSGYSYVDYNGANQMGVSYVQGTIRNGRRCGAEKAYIRPMLSDSNFKLSLFSHVTKVLIHKTNKTAYGVEYKKFGLFTRRVRAKKEVIVCAGAFHSPQILMLSGIGPEDHLTELGIPVIKDLPVGKKLYDHICFLGLIWTVTSNIVISFLNAIVSIAIWLFLGSGPLTSLSAVESLLFFKTTAATHTENYPDMELIYIGGHLHTDFNLTFAKMFRVDGTVYNDLWAPLQGKCAVGVIPMLLQPKSVGNLKLRSKNPFDAPKLYGNYYTDRNGQDIRAMLAAIEESKRIFRASAFQRYGARLRTVPVPGCQQHTFDTDPYWICALRSISVTLHHQTTTCKMGPVADTKAVVDHRCRVHGINKLRVCDTSVIPHPLCAHTNIPAYMIGTKGGYMILEDNP